MATIYLAQKFFTFRDGFSVYGENGQAIYNIKTPLISLTSELKVDNASGKQAGEVRKSMDPLFPGYNLFVNGKKIGRLYQEMSLFGPKMHVTRLDWTVEGNLTGWSYKVKKGFSTIGSISHQFWHMTDHYAISFENDQDALPLLLIALAVFLLNQEQEEQAAAKAGSSNK